jgi:VanZ family protein
LPNNLTVWAIPDIDMKKHLLKLRYVVSLIVVAVAFPFFFLGGTTETSSYLMYAIWDCGHLVFFIAVVAIFSKKFDINNWRVAALISFAVFIFGGSIELIQAYIGRDGSWDDLLRDLTGAWLGIFWLQRSNLWSWIGRAISLALLVPNLTTLYYEGRFQFNLNQQFPILAGFESGIETYGHRAAELSSQYHTQGQYSLKVELTTREYTGVVFNRLVNDWSGYKSFSFDIYNPDPQAFTMTVRVNDAEHQASGWATQDRFNRALNLVQGWNHFTFSLEDIRNAPQNRKMNLTQIMWLEFFAGKLPAPRTIYLDNVRLE